MQYKPFFTLLLLLLIPAAGSLLAQANAIDKYFQEYVNDERFTVVYVSAKVFQLIEKMDLGNMKVNDNESKIIKDMAKDLRGLRILTTDEDPGARLYESARKRIDVQEYEPLVTVRQPGGDNVDFLVHENSSGIIEELLLLSGGADTFTLISFVGKIDLEKIGRLAREIEKE